MHLRKFFMEARVKKKKCENAGPFSSRKTSKIQFFPGNQQHMKKKNYTMAIKQLLQWLFELPCHIL